METVPEKKQKDRRKILYWVTGALSVLIFWKWTGKRNDQEKEKPVKMLTEDGRLVEVDPKYLAGNGKKVTNDEIHNWVMKKK
jgi:hypothetical protein